MKTLLYKTFVGRLIVSLYEEKTGMYVLIENKKYEKISLIPVINIENAENIIKKITGKDVDLKEYQ